MLVEDICTLFLEFLSLSSDGDTLHRVRLTQGPVH